MAGFVKPQLRVAHPFGWFDQLEALLARELAPSSRKLRIAFRLATIGTIGAGLVTSCHVNNELGTYIVWLLVGAGPMMSPRKAIIFLVAEAFALMAAVVMARALAETPWLMIPFLFALFSYSTYLGVTRKLGAALLLIEVVCLSTFYGVVFAPQEIGWGAAGAFGGSVIAFGLIVLFDNWLWPDPGEAIWSRPQTFIWMAQPRGGHRCRRRLPTCPHTWRFSIKRWPRACPSIARRSCLPLSLA
jgi:predicted membrane protein